MLSQNVVKEKVPEMEEQKPSSKQCQIEGCAEISVGSKVPLCRKHRNKTYKQNYKKKKRNAEGNFEEKSKEIVIDDQYLLEQKHSNMLQDVLTQKQMELFESPSVVRLLKSYQNKILATNSHPTTTPHSMSESQLNTSCELIRQPAEGIVSNPSLISSETENVQPQNEVIQVMNSSTDLSPCYNFAWSQDELSLLPCDMIASLETTLPYPNTTSSTTATLEVATGTKTE